MIELPNKNQIKILISSTSRFTGEYKSDDIVINHSWFINNKNTAESFKEGPLSRSYFLIHLEDDKQKVEKYSLLTDYSYIGNYVCSILSVYYGKQFENLGIILSHGINRIPSIEQNVSIRFYEKFINNHQPRKCNPVNLKLEELSNIGFLFNPKEFEKNYFKIFITAAQYYNSALIQIESYPEQAYIHLIMCGEILSNYYDFEDQYLFDSEILNIFSQIEENLEKGSSYVLNLKQRLFQVKRKYVKTIMDLFSVECINVPESHHIPNDFDISWLKKNIESAYDLRSYHMHKGVSFGSFVTFDKDFSLGEFIMPDRDLQKIIKRSPSFWGLERIMRSCLLNFVVREHENNKI